MLEPAVPLLPPHCQESPAFLISIGPGGLAPGVNAQIKRVGRWQRRCSPTPREEGTC